MGDQSMMTMGPPSYRSESHRTLPHIVSFSGGRSSAALALMAAEEGLLRPDRGDLLLFANTSAEHPGTYEFAAECKHRLENEHGLPFLWLEFCTVEDAYRGHYRRRASYRLVKPVPVENDPEGYHSRGEVFEEMLALQGMMPNPHSRTCTAKLKLFPAHSLLADWLGGTEGPSHDGHYWNDDEACVDQVALVAPEEFADGYERRRGTAPREQVVMRAEHLAALPSSRPAQDFSRFTDADVSRSAMSVPLASSPSPPHTGTRDDQLGSLPRPASMRGPSAAQHVRLLGLRADEPKRVDRVLMRCLFAEGAASPGCTVRTQPPGERPYFPLYDAGLCADDVKRYWSSQDFDLDIPDGAGNCTFCFMKGTRQLVELSRADDPQRVKGTPSDIGWWAGVEQRHMRTRPSRDREGVSTFGFFGVNSGTYDDLARGSTEGLDRYRSGTPACDCTD